MDYRAALSKASTAPPPNTVNKTKTQNLNRKPAQTQNIDSNPSHEPTQSIKNRSKQDFSNEKSNQKPKYVPKTKHKSNLVDWSEQDIKVDNHDSLKESSDSSNAFERAKAIHQEKNALFLQKLQQQHGDLFDDSDDESYSNEEISSSLTNSSDLTNSYPNSKSSILKASFSSVDEPIRCSICLEKVKKDHSIWQCSLCFCDPFHLNCITGWINKEKMSPMADLQPSLNEAQTVVVAPSAAMIKFRSTYWQCPNCRGNHELTKAPKEYFCFCGKTKNPEPDPWLQPHCCALVCGKSLKPECGHKCLEKCHAGACPPCSQQSSQSCFCGANSQVLRCRDKNWSCGERCGNMLTCKRHRCSSPCHPGECQPCSYESIEACRCGAESAMKKCMERDWECKNPCNKPFNCEGKHVCKQVCAHICGPCPGTLPKPCFCGKQLYQGKSCTFEVVGCGRTCGKLLECGVHACQRQCHDGPCSPCLQISQRSCVCGRTKKEAPCTTILKCKHNCEIMRNCGRHKCGIKCCPGKGNCPPCKQVCGRKLDCGICTCQGLCHAGACDPCTKTRMNQCKCGIIAETVPCSPKRVLPHLIQKACIGGHLVKKVDCSTPAYLDCNKKCGNLLSCGNCTCSLSCHEKTHFRSLFVDPETGLSSLREVVVPMEPLMMSKDGKMYKEPRVVGIVPGFNKPIVESTIDEDIEPYRTVDTCIKCTKICNMGYLTCSHACKSPCHLNDCPPCPVSLFVDCHCLAKRINYKCHESLDLVKFDEIKSCKQQCPRKLPCSHQCTKQCHSGECISKCQVIGRIVCKCRTLKKDLPCHELIALRTKRKAIDIVLLDCNEECKAKKAAKDAIQQELKKKEHPPQQVNNHIEPKKRKKQEPSISSTGPLAEPTLPIRRRSWIKSMSSRTRVILYSIVGVLILAFVFFVLYISSRDRAEARRNIQRRVPRY